MRAAIWRRLRSASARRSTSACERASASIEVRIDDRDRGMRRERRQGLDVRLGIGAGLARDTTDSTPSGRLSSPVSGTAMTARMPGLADERLDRRLSSRSGLSAR